MSQAASRFAANVQVRAVALVIAAGVFWSLGGVLFRTIESAPSAHVVIYRALALGLGVLALIAVRRRGAVIAAFRDAGPAALAVGVCMAGAMICIIMSYEATTIANASFVLAASPFMAALLAFVFLRERLRPVTWLTMLLAAGGIGVMVAGKLGSPNLVGSLWALGAALAIALFSVLLRATAMREVLPGYVYGGIIAALGITVWLWLGERPELASLANISLHDLAICAAMGWFQMAMGLALYTIGARHVPATEMILLSQTEVVLAPVWVWLVYAETPSLATLAGGAIIFSGIALLAWNSRDGVR